MIIPDNHIAYGLPEPDNKKEENCRFCSYKSHLENDFFINKFSEKACKECFDSIRKYEIENGEEPTFKI